MTERCLRSVVTVSDADADREDVFYVTNKIVGCPAQPEKNDPPSQTALTQLGGTLDFGARWLDRSDKFAVKFIAKLDAVLADREWDFNECRSIAYSANHLAQFRPADRPKGAPLFAEMRRLMRAGSKRQRIGDKAVEALVFWRRAAFVTGGMPFFPAVDMPARGHPRRLDIETDASGNIGFGAFLHPPGDSKHLKPWYFFGRWTSAEREQLDINVKELLVTYWAVCLLGELTPASYAMEHIDNNTAKAVARKNASTKSERLNILAELRAAAAVRTGWKLEQVYINTKVNARADALSRGEMDKFFDSVRELGYGAPVLIELDGCLRDTAFLF